MQKVMGTKTAKMDVSGAGVETEETRERNKIPKDGNQEAVRSEWGNVRSNIFFLRARLELDPPSPFYRDHEDQLTDSSEIRSYLTLTWARSWIQVESALICNRLRSLSDLECCFETVSFQDSARPKDQKHQHHDYFQKHW